MSKAAAFLNSMNMNLKRLEVSDYRDLKKYFESQPYLLSVYSLSSIIAWSNCVFQAHFDVLPDNVLVLAYESEKRPESRHMLMPLSSENDFRPKELYRIASGLGYKNIWFVPEDYLARQEASEVEYFFEVSEQKEYEDYVYLTEDLSKLKGKRYVRKRNLINQFTQENLTSCHRVTVKSIKAADVPECLTFLEQWCEQRRCDIGQDEDLACEKQAVINSLVNMTALEMKGILVRIDHQVSAFAMSSHLTRDMAILNFEKAYSDIKGLYQYLDHVCARELFSGYKYINKESDMGIPNLAKSKKSYHPVMRVRSYRFKLR